MRKFNLFMPVYWRIGVRVLVCATENGSWLPNERFSFSMYWFPCPVPSLIWNKWRRSNVGERARERHCGRRLSFEVPTYGHLMRWIESIRYWQTAGQQQRYAGSLEWTAAVIVESKFLILDEEWICFFFSLNLKMIFNSWFVVFVSQAWSQVDTARCYSLK